MADFIPFVPVHTKNAESNRNDFVVFARKRLMTFGSDLDFDSTRWDVTNHFRRRGDVASKWLIFHQLGYDRGYETDPLGEPLASFARAYIRYICARDDRTSLPTREVGVFRLIEAALIEMGRTPDIGLLDAFACDRALDIARSHNADSTRALIGSNLEALVRFLRKNCMTDRLHVHWKHGIKIDRRAGRASGAAAEARLKKLPSREALEAVPKAYLLAVAPRHVITTSAVAFLLCAPERINEVVGVPEKLEVEDTIDGKAVFGLRWTGSKGHPDHIKYIPSSMVDLARDAIARLRRTTDDARRIARWYEETPGKLWLEPDCEHLRDCDLSLEDIQRIIGFRGVTGALAFCNRMGVKPHGRRPGKTRHMQVYRFDDVERAIIAKLPANFPIADPATGLTYKDALFVCRYNTFNEEEPWRCMIEPVKIASIYGQIKKNADGRKNMFDQLGLATPDSPISLTSHQLRHYLNTVAHDAGLSDFDIAAWSGRLKREQNSSYDHETPESIIEKARAVKRIGRDVASRDGGVDAVSHVPVAEPVSRRAIVSASMHGHATEYGFCEHDFAAAPCSMFMNCLNCRKHACIKGADPNQLARLERALELSTISLSKARDAEVAEFEGAADWVSAHERTVERLRQLIGFLIDPQVPEGSVIRLMSSGEYNLVEQALHDRGLIIHPEPSSLPASRSTIIGRPSP